MPVVISLLLVAIATTGPAAVRQESGISGTWRGTAEATSRRNADGTIDILSSRPFALVLSTEGGRVTGTWSETSFTWDATGTWRDGALALTTSWRELPGGDSGTERFRWVIRGALRDGRLEGTRYLDVEGRDREPVFLKWTAERQRAPRA